MSPEELHDGELLQYGGLEFPQINYEACNGRNYRFFYSCGFGHVFADSLLKMDVHTKELKVTSASGQTPVLVCGLGNPGPSPAQVWRHPGLYPSEPVFVASPGAAEEDDGVVLSVIVTPRKASITPPRQTLARRCGFERHAQGARAQENRARVRF